MKGYDESRKCYGDATRGDETVAVTFLAKLAGRGPALELGIGAGRIALPLTGHNIRVDGIDISLTSRGNQYYEWQRRLISRAEQ